MTRTSFARSKRIWDGLAHDDPGDLRDDVVQAFECWTLSVVNTSMPLRAALRRLASALDARTSALVCASSSIRITVASVECAIQIEFLDSNSTVFRCSCAKYLEAMSSDPCRTTMGFDDADDDVGACSRAPSDCLEHRVRLATPGAAPKIG